MSTVSSSVFSVYTLELMCTNEQFVSVQTRIQNLYALHLSIFSCIFSYKIEYFFSFKKFNRLFLSSCSFMKNFSGKYREVPYIYLFLLHFVTAEEPILIHMFYQLKFIVYFRVHFMLFILWILINV